jgi:ribosomal protein S18 acetylase RimI-like enzyme
MFETEVVWESDEKILNDIVSINRDSFPPGWAYHDAEQYYRAMLRRKNNIHIVLRDHEKRIGYLLAIPHDAAVVELKNDDPKMENDPLKYYIETVEILPKYRGQKGLSKMLDRLIAECQARGITKISLHARVKTGFSGIVQRKFGVAAIRRIERWSYYNFEEPTDYIEATIIPERGKNTGFDSHPTKRYFKKHFFRPTIFAPLWLK